MSTSNQSVEKQSILWKNRDGELVTITPDPHKIASIFYANDSDNQTVEYYDKLAEQIKPSRPQEPQISADEVESELVNEICKKFEQIGIDTSEWEYKFGDGHFAAEFIQAGIKDYLENNTAALKSPISEEQAEFVYVPTEDISDRSV